MTKHKEFWVRIAYGGNAGDWEARRRSWQLGDWRTASHCLIAIHNCPDEWELRRKPEVLTIRVTEEELREALRKETCDLPMLLSTTMVLNVFKELAEETA